MEKLDMADVGKDPFVFFENWLEQAIAAGIVDPSAMLLSTVDEVGQPSSRTVLLKGVDVRGFIFFTNYASRKGRQIAANSRVALCFQWLELERQVHVEGVAEKVSPQESDEYFESRPFESQVGAHASRQSEAIAARRELELEFERLLREFEGGAVRRPDNWGGYVVRPMRMEFWQGRPGRLHDRIEFTRDAMDEWLIRRLSP